MLSNFFIIIHLEGSLNKHFMVCPYIVSRDHKKLVKPHELQIINIDNNIERQPLTAPKSTCMNIATNRAVYIVIDPSKANTKQEEVTSPAPMSPEEAAHALELKKTRRWLESL